MNPAGIECRTCIWFRVHNEWQGECRRRAPLVDPQAVVGSQSESTGGELMIFREIKGPRTLWPVVSAGDFCGEYESAPPRSPAGSSDL